MVTNRSIMRSISLLATAGFAALTAYAAAPPLVPTSSPTHAAPKHSTAEAERLISNLDSIVQPRFQVMAGRFGADRVEFYQPDGHSQILFSETTTEQKKLTPLDQSRRPYIMAIMHVRHKPGSHINGENQSLSDRLENGKGLVPGVDVLNATGATDERAKANFDWAQVHLEKDVLPYVAAARKGKTVSVTDGHWFITMRPVRAESTACLSCHVGAKRGDTLGAMVYAITIFAGKNKANGFYNGQEGGGA